MTQAPNEAIRLKSYGYGEGGPEFDLPLSAIAGFEGFALDQIPGIKIKLSDSFDASNLPHKAYNGAVSYAEEGYAYVLGSCPVPGVTS